MPCQWSASWHNPSWMKEISMSIGPSLSCFFFSIKRKWETKPGLGIHFSVFQANHSFLWAKVRFALFFLVIRSFVKSKLSNLLMVTLLLCVFKPKGYNTVNKPLGERDGSTRNGVSCWASWPPSHPFPFPPCRSQSVGTLQGGHIHAMGNVHWEMYKGESLLGSVNLGA